MCVFVRVCSSHTAIFCVHIFNICTAMSTLLTPGTNSISLQEEDTNMKSKMEDVYNQAEKVLPLDNIDPS